MYNQWFTGPDRVKSMTSIVRTERDMFRRNNDGTITHVVFADEHRVTTRIKSIRTVADQPTLFDSDAAA